MKEATNGERLTEPAAEAVLICLLQATLVEEKVGAVDARIYSHRVPSCSIEISAISLANRGDR